MNNDTPQKIISFAEALGGRLISDQSQVSDDDIVVVVSAYRPENINAISKILFLFPDEEAREIFRDAIFLSYGDPKQFAPWKAGGYLRQSAGDYFRGSSNSGGTSGSALVDTSFPPTRRRDG